LPSLPSDVLVYMMTFLDPYDLAQVSRLSKRFNGLADADQIWKSLYVRDLEYSKAGTTHLTGDKEVHPGGEEDQKTLWKTRYRLSREWQWDTSRSGKSLSLQVNNLGRTVSRPSQEGINPLVRTTKPFTAYRNYIEFIVEDVGNWFRCGVADTNVILDDGNLLGGQLQSFNIGFCKSGSIYYSYKHQMDKKTPCVAARKRILGGSRVGIQYEEAQDTFYFYFDGQLVESLQLSPATSTKKSKEIFPAVQLSYSSGVTINHKFCHRSTPTLPESDEVLPVTANSGDISDESNAMVL